MKEIGIIKIITRNLSYITIPSLYISSFHFFLKKNAKNEICVYMMEIHKRHTIHSQSQSPFAIVVVVVDSVYIILFFSGPQKQEKRENNNTQAPKRSLLLRSQRPNVSEKVDTGRQKFII
ncbi:CLUMA_CG014332, isoform A [Clunio marinus]|uniref:CLUMA_CG014332, isoform A n=1 Tax=Clunio marinus TaxID=568069 RepID=A0A1J1ILH3_9DIPT|nr:CLUMA_CG014332, isoform A [Clunio marinus]